MSLAAAAHGQVQKNFVINNSNRTIYRYNESLASTSNWTTGATDPEDIAVTDTNAYVLDDSANRAVRYTYSGGSSEKLTNSEKHPLRQPWHHHWNCH